MEVVPLLLIGMSSKCSTFPSRELMDVTYMMLSTRRLPEGVIALFLAIAATTSSADKLYIRNFSGLTLISTDLALEPKGGGAWSPGTVANRGRTLVRARSKISLSDLVLLL